jgi:FkbM family methyltransferase
MTRPIELARRARRLLHEWTGRDVATRVFPRADALHLGSEYGGWVVASSLVRADSVVYSFGVGHDISFDHAMIDRFGTAVHAFDPTPAVAQFVRDANPPEKFRFVPLGLAGHDGELRFAFRHANQATVEQSTTGEVVLPVRRLRSFMRDLGHDRIDVLKVDIEGSEHAFIDDLASDPVPVGQLLIEFHHAPDKPDVIAQVRRSLGQLESLGFQLFARSAVGKEFSFFGRGAAGKFKDRHE